MVANQWGSLLLVLNKFGVLSVRMNITYLTDEGLTYQGCQIQNFFGVNEKDEVAVNGQISQFDNGFAYLSSVGSSGILTQYN